MVLLSTNTFTQTYVTTMHNLYSHFMAMLTLPHEACDRNLTSAASADSILNKKQTSCNENENANIVYF